MESCSHPQTKRHDVAASGRQGGWEILFGWVVMGWCYYRRREGKSGGGGQLEFLPRKGSFALDPEEPQGPPIKWGGAGRGQ